MPGHLICILCATLIWLGPAMAEDGSANSQPLPDYVTPLTAGEPVWLQGEEGTFLALHQPETTGTPQGGAIIIPTVGTHADWPRVISPLRRALPAYGWATLAIAPPADSAVDPAWHASIDARLAAAVTFFKQRGIKNIAVVGHGAGAAATAVALAGPTAPTVSAFVAISMGLPTPASEQLYRPGLLQQIKVPVLDIYGSRDLPEVTRHASHRTGAARRRGTQAAEAQEFDPLRRSAAARIPLSEQSGYIAYRQMALTGADHFFNGYDHVLTKRIAGWLHKHAAGAIAAPSLSPKTAGRR